MTCLSIREGTFLDDDDVSLIACDLTRSRHSPFPSAARPDVDQSAGYLRTFVGDRGAAASDEVSCDRL